MTQRHQQANDQKSYFLIANEENVSLETDEIFHDQHSKVNNLTAVDNETENNNCPLDSDDEWNEVDEEPSGTTDTLLEQSDINHIVDALLTVAPGESNRPLGIFADKDSEFLFFPTIFCGNCEVRIAGWLNQLQIFSIN